MVEDVRGDLRTIARLSRAGELILERDAIFTNELDAVAPGIIADLEGVIEGDFDEEAASDRIQTIVIATTAVAVLLAIGACWYLIRIIVTPLRRLIGCLDALAKGDTSFEVRAKTAPMRWGACGQPSACCAQKSTKPTSAHRSSISCPHRSLWQTLAMTSRSRTSTMLRQSFSGRSRITCPALPTT